MTALADAALIRLITVQMRLGFYDAARGIYGHIGPESVDTPAHRMLAQSAAEQSFVMLKNDNHALPLDQSAVRTIALIGPFADDQHNPLGNDLMTFGTPPTFHPMGLDPPTLSLPPYDDVA